MNCTFEPLPGGGQRCINPGCGRLIKTLRPVIAACRAHPAVGRPQQAPPADNAACLHRGEVLRVEQCRTCQGQIDLPVYQCAVYGECTRENHARKNPALAATHVCRGCPAAKLAEPALPGKLSQAANFSKALVRDALNGRQRRSAALIAKIFEKHCRVCPLYNSVEQACSACGCPVHDFGLEANKLAWASESCPDGRWPIQRANLLYYVLPLRHPENVWQWNVEQIRRRLSLFNGRRIVTIATAGPGERLALEPPEKVIEAFGDAAARIEFIQRPNDQYWETPHFRRGLVMLAYGVSADEADTIIRTAGNEGNKELPSFPSVRNSSSEATFYAHAKGVRRAKQEAVRAWTQKMYAHNLDRWDEIRELLSVYPCCGIAQQPSNPANLRDGGGWHFAGTFFWFNHALFGGETWKNLRDHTHAVEGYLSAQFRADEAYCLAFKNCGPVYTASSWLDRAAEARDSANVPQAPPPELTISVLVTARNYGRFLEECLQSVLSQTRPAEQVLYCDDASDDGSPQIAARLLGWENVIALPKQLGAELARNEAAKQATGRALLFLDGDNVLPPDYLERMAAKLTNSTPFVYPDLRHFGAVERLDQMVEWQDHDLRAGNLADTCSLMWREAFEAVGGWRPGFQHLGDWNLFLRLAHLGTPARAGVALGYRRHGGSMSDLVHAAETDESRAAISARVLADVDAWAAEWGFRGRG